ncbi:DUF4329 domain-containing protein [Pontivivens insulae]|uniref:DUF4329 domain-containing protein n=1 Tax=Pontivivens insulae TaxID=1639689 RepID=A0A2R8A727_9RHOB|nr:DUF4329 domain-containing protein [Pontivivens insulae]RED18154.1 uncharacterized protein DUF4329 [Pontivivens insulae]SPF28051.1 hypothetical protein POI8812_00349 [Pontivivens insulae]
MLRYLILGFVLMGLGGPLVAQTKGGRSGVLAEHALARQVLEALQERSIAESREYCGYLAYDRHGELRATPAGPGSRAGCSIKAAPGSWRVVASYHTHGAWTREYDDEVPSTIDLVSDANAGTNGYISTPGGRLWFHNHRTGIAGQLCGLGCLTQDPNFTTSGSAPVRDFYTLDTLRNRFGE